MLRLASNREKKHAKNNLTEEDFVRWRNERDQVIPEPRLVQVNVHGGKMPSKSHDGKAYMLYLIEVPSSLLG